MELGSVVVAIVNLTLSARPGVEQDSSEVHQEDGGEHTHGYKQEQGLHKGKILVFHRLQEHVPDSRVGEDVLDQYGPGHHEAERHGEASQVGEYGISAGVIEHDPQW